MQKRISTPPTNRRVAQSEQAASSGGAVVKGADSLEQGSPRPSSPFAALSLRRTRFSSVPLVHIKQNVEVEGITFPASVELPRRHVTFYTDTDSDASFTTGGLCSMSDTMESFRDAGGSPILQQSVRIKHLTRNSDGTSRFPKLDECAHFHYDNVELGPIEVVLCECEERGGIEDKAGSAEGWFGVRVSSNGKSWQIRRSLDNFQMLDRQLHRCVYDRKFSLLQEIATQPPQQPQDAVRIMLTQYLERFSHLAGSLINCGPVLNWLELDNRGNRLIVTDEAAINTPAVAAAYVVKRYASQASDEISLEVGDIISVIDMPPPAESSWWRAKKGFQVGFFPCECVEIIGDKVPQSFKIPKTTAKPVLRKHGKLIAFFRSFLLSRPSRRKLKQSGILKERVFGCDLGEHLMNTGRDIPLVLKCCTEFIEQYGIVDGIYRLSGVTSNIQKLRVAFDEDRVPNLTDEAILQDIHCVASLLKMYFRELPNPLLTFHLYDKFVAAVQAEEELRLLQLRDVVQQLPPPHYRSLEYLMRHLSRVAAHGSRTGMTPKNVAIVWAPNLLRSRDIESGGVCALHVVGVQAVLTEYLIRYTDIIFSEKMPVFPSPKVIEVESPKKTRPKSLAISTPTKLLSLEEARSRALASTHLPGEPPPKFIDVGGGEEGLPLKYHTIIDLPSRRRSMGKGGKKSPSGWRSFFSRGWQTTSGRRKQRRAARERPKIGSPIFTGKTSLILQDKAITESDMSHTNSKKLRTVKSAETLFPLCMDSSQQMEEFGGSPSEENASSSLDVESNSSTKDVISQSSSSSKVPSYQKHYRSVSHDSYFERSAESEFEDGGECLASSVHPETGSQSASAATGRTAHASFLSKDSPSRRSKAGQKQKLTTSETEASSPKLQKLSLKHVHHNFDSPPQTKRTGKAEVDDTSNTFLNKHSYSTQCETHTQIAHQNTKEAVPSHQNTAKFQESTHSNAGSEQLDTVMVEIHKYIPVSDAIEKMADGEVEDAGSGSLVDESENLMDFSMEATLSESVNISQLMSFESQEHDVASERRSRILPEIPCDSSLTTPDSPTGDNVSDIPSSPDSENSGSSVPVSAGRSSSDFVSEVRSREQLNNRPQVARGISEMNDVEVGRMKSGNTVSVCEQVHSGVDVASDATKSAESPSTSLNLNAQMRDKQLALKDNFIDDIILSPPESFVDEGKKRGGMRKGKNASEVAKMATKSPGLRSLERSKTEVQEICSLFDSGVAVSGSFAGDLFRANAESLDANGLHKKRSCSDKLSPISPIEDSRRRFESEIGRLIVRDRQMKLEMEQMKAERQMKKAESPTKKEGSWSKSEKKFADALDFRKSPVKSADRERTKLDCEDFLKSFKENLDDKRLPEGSSSYPRYVRIDSKPSVKELLSKFESNAKRNDDDLQKSFSDCATSTPNKQSSGVFSNVQVINHNFPLATSSSFASSFESSKDNLRRLSKEHIFQTECVIRFPHPKSSRHSNASTEPRRFGSKNRNYDEYVESNSWTPGQHDSPSRVSRSRTSFISTDNLANSPASPVATPSVSSSAQLRQRAPVESSLMSRSLETKDLVNALQNDKNNRKDQITEEGTQSSNVDNASAFSTFKEAFNRANRITQQMKAEFLQRGLPQGVNGNEIPFFSPNDSFSSNHYARSPPVCRKRQVPIRQRPKSVPPPVCRLSLGATQPTLGAQPTAPLRDNFSPTTSDCLDNVPKTLTNGKKSGDSSQNCRPSQRVKDRAAIFERSLSFSGATDKRPSPSSKTRKAQNDSSVR